MNVLREYRNLTQDELEMADHYAEIGDRAGLVQMQKLSRARGGNDQTKPYNTHLPTQRR